MLKYALASILVLSSMAHAGVEGIGEPRITWTSRKVHVCWHISARDNPAYAANDFNQAQKDVVKAIIEKEFTQEKTGISFYGFENCVDIANGKYDIEIFQDSEIAPTNPQVESHRKTKAEGWSVLGEGSSAQISRVTDTNGNLISETSGYLNRRLVKNSMYLLVRAPDFRSGWDSYFQFDELEFTSLHEFGHAAGLRHEHLRGESINDPNCKNRQDTNSETIMQTAVLHGEYDPNSIMNYCWGATLVSGGTKFSKKQELPNVPDTSLVYEVVEPINKNKTYNIRVGLSAKDIATLRKLYPVSKPKTKV